MGCAVDLSVGHLAHFLQFSHEVLARVQPACGVHQDHVRLPTFLARPDGIVDHSSRIRSLLLRNQIHPCPLAPDPQLVDRGCSVGIRGGHHHPLVLVAVVVGQLADGGGFAGPVDANHESHREQARALQFKRFGGRHPGLNLALQDTVCIVRRHIPFLRQGIPRVGNQPLRHMEAGIAHHQVFLDFLPGVVRDGTGTESGPDPA